MAQENSIKSEHYPFILAKLKDYALIMKPKVSLLVVFSCIIAFLLVPDKFIAQNVNYNWLSILLLGLSGMLITNGAHAINQTIERFSDIHMKRTQNRPMPNGRISLWEARILSFVTTTSGVLIIGLYFNWYAAAISIASLIIYGFIYTPLKKMHPVATYVGSIPGALPPLIGWVAATGSIHPDIIVGGLVLFTIQFFWQFPHVWTIAWRHHDDYSKAGICLLPNRKGKTSSAGLYSMIYALPLIPFSIALWQLGITGKVSMWIAIILGCIYVINSYSFYKKNDEASAKKLFFTSLFYLPIVLIAFLIDKI